MEEDLRRQKNPSRNLKMNQSLMRKSTSQIKLDSLNKRLSFHFLVHSVVAVFQQNLEKPQLVLNLNLKKTMNRNMNNIIILKKIRNQNLIIIITGAAPGLGLKARGSEKEGRRKEGVRRTMILKLLLLAEAIPLKIQNIYENQCISKIASF